MRHAISRHQTPPLVQHLHQPEQDVFYVNSNESGYYGVLNEKDTLDFPSPLPNVSTQRTANNPDPEIAQLYRIIIPVMLFICLMSFLANLLIVCSVRWIRRRKLSNNLLLSLSLAGADAFASLIVGLGLVLNSFLPVAFDVHLGPGCLCLVLALEALRNGSLVSTALHLLALAVNHHVGIANPLHYVRIVTRRTTLLSAAAIWVVPIAFFFVYFSSVPDGGFQSHECSNFEFLYYSTFRVTLAVLYFMPLIAMVVFYAHIFAIVRRHQPQNNSSSDRRLKRNVKAAVTTLLILGAYVLGWMPAVLYFALTCLDCPIPFPDIPMSIRVPVGFTTNAMIVARCLVDPALYLIRMPEIRDALRDMFKFRTLLTRNSSNPSSLQNTRTDVRRLTLLTSQRKLNGYASGRNVIVFERKEIML